MLKTGFDLPPTKAFNLVLNLTLLLEQRLHFFGRHLLSKAFGDALELLEQAHHLTSTFLDDFENGPRFVSERLLFQITGGEAFGHLHLTLVFGIFTCNDPKYSALTSSVEP